MEKDQTSQKSPSGDSHRSEQAPGKKKRRWVLWVVLVLVILLVARFLHMRKQRGPKPQPQDTAQQSVVPHIRTATAERGTIGSYIEALGNVTPLATVNVYSQVTGRVDAVHYAEGQIVHKGDPLIDIDPRPFEAQLKQAEGTLDRDQALLKQAEMDLARYEQAVTNDALARQTYEDQKLTVEQYRGTVKNDAGQVEYAQAELSYCHIFSPINGRVGLRLVDPGNTIFSGGTSPIVVVTQLQPITVVFNVAEDDLNQVRGEITHRQKLPVYAYDRSQLTKIAEGRLLTLDNQIDSSTGTVRFRGQFDNGNLALFPNQFVNTRLLVKTMQNVILVPGGAVQHNGTQAFVYLVSNEIAKMHPVSELGTDGDRTAVGGLNDGDVVATTGFDKLQDGAKIVVQNQTVSGGGPRPQSGAQR